MKIRTKLSIVLLVIVIPLVLGAYLTINRFTLALRRAAESELENVVSHLIVLCESQRPFLADEDKVEALEEAMLSIRVGETGYAYVIDVSGSLVIHPTRRGENILDERDSNGFAFIREICETAPTFAAGKVGTIRYPWMNPELGEVGPRMKMLKFRYFKDWDWIIAAGGYEDEIFQAARKTTWIMVVIASISLFLAFVLPFILGRTITRPIMELNEVATRMANGDLSQKVELSGDDEIGRLARSFNTMANQVRENTGSLEQLVREQMRKINASERKYRSLVENSVDAILTTDKKGYITFVNVGMEEMFGVSKENFLGRHISNYYKNGIDEARKLMDILRRDGMFQNQEIDLIKEGSTIPILASSSLLRNEEEEIAGTLGIFTDITERKALEDKLKMTQAHLVQTMKLRALGDLVAGVAHEINNPLMASQTIVHVMANALHDECPNARRVKLIQECNDRIAKIVDHLRDFSRQSKFDFKPSEVNLPVENALLITGQQLLNHNIGIVKELGADLPRVRGDVNQLEQVFLDLISNARDAMEGQEREKTLTFRSYLTDSENGEEVVISLQDSGKGISPDILDKIFEPFFSTKGAGKGTGLGLSICYGIIEEHGGRLAVESEEGVQTTFKVILPVYNRAGAGESVESNDGKGSIEEE
ncbi:ATP-binding protein [Thermodesulfobacteriota bacterium]